MANLSRNYAKKLTAFFSKEGAEGETDPCLVIDADREFYSWLFNCFGQTAFSELELLIADLKVQFRLASEYRSFIEDDSFVIQFPPQQTETLLKTIEPLTRKDVDLEGGQGERTVHVFLDILDGFEVILRRHVFA